MERCGRRVLGAVQGPVGHAFWACSMGPARSIGRWWGSPHALALGPRRVPGSRIVEGSFMLVEQAIASRRGREAGARFVRDFIRDAGRSGLLARIVDDNRVRGVTIAPMEE